MTLQPVLVLAQRSRHRGFELSHTVTDLIPTDTLPGVCVWGGGASHSKEKEKEALSSRVTALLQGGLGTADRSPRFKVLGFSPSS